MIHELGSGGYATVYKARRESDGEVRIFALGLVEIGRATNSSAHR